MELHTMTDLGALVREARKAQGLTQVELATRMGVTPKWVNRLEHGSPRAEAQKVLDALAALNVPLTAGPSPHHERERGEDSDPFAEVFDNLGPP